MENNYLLIKMGIKKEILEIYCDYSAIVDMAHELDMFDTKYIIIESKNNTVIFSK